jgi:hypothetical protein
MRFADSAFDHGKTEEEILFVYASPSTEWFPNGTSDRGNERAMLVGFDMNGNLFEAALELMPGENGEDEDEEYFYHAMTATPDWQKKYERRRRD